MGFFRRHRAAIASNTALALAAGVVVVYAVAADGYQAHETQLNDGGIWVVHGDRGIYGRINKPINELDTTVFSEDGPELPLDVVQDGAVVAAVDNKAGTAQIIDNATAKFDTRGRISIPSIGDLQMAGGSFASIDTETGDLWAVQVDPQLGKPLISPLDVQADPVDTVGEGAALAVSQSGTVAATSQEKETITYLEQSGVDFTKPRTEDLASNAGDPTAVTFVGDTPVTLDGESGALSVVDGGSATVPAGSLLQQAGPDADSVLVATPDSLLRIDLETGDASVVAEVAAGTAIEPVRLGACSYAAWSGGRGTVVVQCGDDEPQVSPLNTSVTDLAFRVNRGQIVLNDKTSGAVWDLDQDSPEKIDNWNAFTTSKKKKDDTKESEQQTSGEQSPPEAKPDTYGARAGRATVLHPLDNDSAPNGRLLSIVGVDQPSGDASATISPDGQTIVLTMPSEARDTSFDYYIDDGRNQTASATVQVNVRGDAQNEPPALRDSFESRKWRVAAGNSVNIPVLADWRDDDDGDPLVLDSAVVLGEDGTAATGVVARTTSDGRVRFTGSRNGGDSYQVEYAVSDGRSSPVTQTLSFDVQDKFDLESFPAIAEPDVVRGEVGQPIKIRPLLNDLPGSDPSTAEAELALGGKIAPQTGVSIKTDVENGIVTFSATKPDTYFVDYNASFGNAKLARATMRIDVRPEPKEPGDPIAMPDTLTVFGQAAGIIDVLANDTDPAGGLLAVQQATTDNDNQLDVAIIDGRWLRISSRQGELAPNPQIVRYTVSNGSRSGIVGEVTVNQRQTPPDNAPVTTTDRVQVRAGTSITAAVLDNDIAASGDRLTLVPDADTGVPGELKIEVPKGYKGEVGTALVAGRNVRYVAPLLKEKDKFEIRYIAQSSTGETAPGRLLVSITPDTKENAPPEPPTLEARVSSGGTVKIRLPGSGIDPDGDPVTVTGITSAPRFGRLVSYGGNFLEYQAYPSTTGTDEFDYSVTDSRGAVATGTARVGVVPQSDPQRPLAVSDQLTVEPGRTGVFDPLANDFVSPGDDVKISLKDAPEGVVLDAKTNLVSVPAPDSEDGASVQVVYEISNGVERSSSTMTLEPSVDFKNPPVVYDAFGRADDSESVSVNVLEGAFDPDGSASDLKVTEVLSAEGNATINQAQDTIKVNRSANPIVLPFRVEDADGAATTASLYVPPTGTAIPFVKPGKEIKLEEGGSAKGKLSDYIATPGGGDLRLTGRGAASASPSNLQSNSDGLDGFEVSARSGYRGPGAVLVEVTTALDEAGNEDPQDPTDGYTALLSIPVQVGDNTPEVRCPPGVITMSAGQSVLLDIAARCNIYTPDPADADDLGFDATWTQELDGLSVTGSGTPVLEVNASEDATNGGEAVLSITAQGSDPAEFRFRMESAPPPRLQPIRGEPMQAGETREIDLARYLEPGVANATPTVVTVSAIGSAGVTASKSGQSSITLRAGDQAQGRAAFRVVMSDVADSSGPERRAEGRIEFDVSGPPGETGQPFVFAKNEENVFEVTWDPPKQNGGSPILRYVLKETKGKTITCRTSVCDYPNAGNGQREYTFRVAAVNKAGQGPWSVLSKIAYADTKPDRIGSIRMVSRGDGTITLGWPEPRSSTPIEYYTITSINGSVTVAGNTRQAVITGLDNNQRYAFRIRAKNKIDLSPERESPFFQSIGTPAPPLDLKIVDRQSGQQATEISATWATTLPEGPAPTLYTLSYSRAGGPQTPVPGCARIQATTCAHANIPYDGSTYNYVVQAHNEQFDSGNSTPQVFEAVGKPDQWGAISATPTGEDNRVRVTGVAPNSRGKQSRAAIIVGNDQVVWEYPVAAGAVINEVVATPGNDQAYAVRLRMCNEKAATVGCSVSDAKAVQSYGSLRPEHIQQPQAQVNGLQVTWTIGGTANGDAALVGISIDGGAEEIVPTPGTGSFSFVRTVNVADYDSETSIRVRLFDNAPGGRGEAVTSANARSGPPPDPVLTLLKGEACTTGGTPNCLEAEGGNLGDCPNPSNADCAFVVIDWKTNFVGDIQCSIESLGPDEFSWTYRDRVTIPSGTGNKPRASYFGGDGHQVRLRCNRGFQNFPTNGVGSW